MNAVRAQLAPTGVLRAGLNLSNVLLNSGRDSAGNPTGIAPDLGRVLGRILEVDVQMVPFPHPDKLCNAAGDNFWDIALVGADPARAGKIDFTPAYCEIQATYMVPMLSKLRRVADVDQPGRKVAVKGSGAYDLWLSRNLQHAELVRAETLDASYELFHNEGLDALAGLRPKLLSDLKKTSGTYRVLDEHFMAVQQAIGCIKTTDGNTAGIDFLSQFVEECKSKGLIQELIDRHNITGRLSVAPLRQE